MRIFPPFIKFLFFTNGFIFLIQTFLDSGFRYHGVPIDNVFTEWFALWPIESGSFMPWQLITYQFLHGGFGHIFFNLFALWMFGMELENMWGSKKFAVFYLLSGIVAGLVHLGVGVAFPGEVYYPTLGASGAIMGVLLAFGMTFPTRPVMIFPIFFPIPARIFVILYAGFDLIMGLSNNADGVAHFAHLGGALGGFLLLRFGEPLWRWLDQTGSQRREWTQEPYVDARFRDRESAPREPVVIRYEPPAAEQRAPERTTQTPSRFVVDGRVITQEEIDAILDKISVNSYHNLSDQEKKILYEVSKQL